MAENEEGKSPPLFEPVTLYDDSGNEVKAVNVEKVNELTGKIEALEKELSGLKEKDYNFDRFRHKTEEEKKEIIEGMTQKEKLLYERIDGLEKDRETEKMARMNETKDVVLDQLAGVDADLKKAIELQEKEFIGHALTPKEYEERLRKAYTLVKGYKPRANPLHTPLGTTYREPDISQKRYTDTEKGRKQYAAMYPDSSTVKKWKDEGKL